jgi:hypothetical protein
VTTTITALEVKAFVPAIDLEVSKQFYLALGFQVRWSSEGLTCLQLGGTSFLLQAFNEPAFARNYQMHLLVNNVDAWHAHVMNAGVASRFGVQVGEPGDRPWGMRDFTLFDPGGVLWRIAQATA